MQASPTSEGDPGETSPALSPRGAPPDPLFAKNQSFTSSSTHSSAVATSNTQITNSVIQQLRGRNEELAATVQGLRRAESSATNELTSALRVVQLYKLRELALIPEQEVDKREVLCANEAALRRSIQTEFFSMRRLFMQRNTAENELHLASRDISSLHTEISNLTLKIGEQSQMQSNLENERQDTQRRYEETLHSLEDSEHSALLAALQQEEAEGRRSLAMGEGLALSGITADAMRVRDVQTDTVLRRVFEAGEMRLLAERVLAEQQDRDAAVLALRHEAETTLNQLSSVLAKKEAALRQISDLLEQNAVLSQELSASQSKLDFCQEEKIQLNQKIASLRNRKHDRAEREKERERDDDHTTSKKRGHSRKRSRSCESPQHEGNTTVVTLRGGGDVEAILTQREARSLATEISNLRKSCRILKEESSEEKKERVRTKTILDKKCLEVDSLRDRVRQLQRRLNKAHKEKADLTAPQPTRRVTINTKHHHHQQHQHRPSSISPRSHDGSCTPPYNHSFEPTDMRTAIRAQRRSSTTSPIRQGRRYSASLSPPRNSMVHEVALSPMQDVGEHARITSLRNLLGSKEDYITVLKGEVDRTAVRLDSATAKVQALETELARKESEMRLAEATGAAERATPDRRALQAESYAGGLRERVATLEADIEGKNKEIEDFWQRLDSRDDEVERLAGRLRDVEAHSIVTPIPMPVSPLQSPTSRNELEEMRTEVLTLRETARIMAKKQQYYENRVNELKDDREKSILHNEELERQLREAHQCAANAALEINSIVVERGLEKERYSSIITQLESRVQNSSQNISIQSVDASRIDPLSPRCASCDTLHTDLQQKSDTIRALQANIDHLQSQLRSARYRASQSKAAASSAEERAKAMDIAYQRALQKETTTTTTSTATEASATRSPRLSPLRPQHIDRATSPPASVVSPGRREEFEAKQRGIKEDTERELRTEMAEREARCERILKDAKARMHRERHVDTKHHNEVADLQLEIDNAHATLKQVRAVHMREVAELRLNAERLSARADSRQGKIRELQQQLRDTQEPESIVLEKDLRNKAASGWKRRK